MVTDNNTWEQLQLRQVPSRDDEVMMMKESDLLINGHRQIWLDGWVRLLIRWSAAAVVTLMGSWHDVGSRKIEIDRKVSSSIGFEAAIQEQM
ncbi:hypothetical protein ACLOJK_006089 [Asimina triloba]